MPLNPKDSRITTETARVGMTETRPWGRWTVLGDGEGYKVKQIDVDPGCRLSLQFHHHRSEHWIVVSGVARVTIGERVADLRPQGSAFVPAGTSHRIENPGPLPLTIIEIQSGTYLGEDDIVRLHDDYGRGDGG
jgi:mannose-6-phosphate isomerase-like protein (cupin superfamily)